MSESGFYTFDDETTEAGTVNQATDITVPARQIQIPSGNREIAEMLVGEESGAQGLLVPVVPEIQPPINILSVLLREESMPPPQSIYSDRALVRMQRQRLGLSWSAGFAELGFWQEYRNRSFAGRLNDLDAIRYIHTITNRNSKSLLIVTDKTLVEVVTQLMGLILYCVQTDVIRVVFNTHAEYKRREAKLDDSLYYFGVMIVQNEFKIIQVDHTTSFMIPDVLDPAWYKIWFKLRPDLAKPTTVTEAYLKKIPIHDKFSGCGRTDSIGGRAYNPLTGQHFPGYAPMPPIPMEIQEQETVLRFVVASAAVAPKWMM